jgi:hypothetical protein
VVNGSAVLSILLVITLQGDWRGVEERGKGGGVGEHGAIGAAKRDILGPELDRARLDQALGHRVLADPQQKENAVETRSAVARVRGSLGPWWCAPALSIVATGMASWGCGAGSELR